MKTLKQILAIFAVALLGTLAAAAQTRQTHTVQRGESLESIAAKYGVSTQAIRDANPQMTAIFVGYKIIIPEAAPAQATDTPARTFAPRPAQQTEAPAHSEEYTDKKEFSPQDFNNVYISYSGSFSAYDKGVYGIGWIGFDDKGIGLEQNFNTNYGIIKKYGRGLIYKPGVAYGHAFNKYVMLYAPLRFHLTYLEAGTGQVDGKGNAKTKLEFNFGVTLGPGIVVKLGRIVLSSDIELGWMHDYNKLYSALTFHIGFSV
ncbi:MAG: LysM peptidoglycan-binding domain-containing protein [Muribaculaceae bacterium]|nr:LysM peptidoglycan-binding domain-containing protein [Muribaculaceae bacterium]